jgi:hypothetical protein
VKRSAKRRASFFLFGEVLLDVRSFGDLGPEVSRPIFIAELLHLLVLGVFRGAGADESRDKGLVRGGLDAGGEGDCGASGVLGFVASDGISKGVLGDRPGTVRGVSVG